MLTCGLLSAVTCSLLLYCTAPMTAIHWMVCSASNILVGSLLATFIIFAVQIISIWWLYIFLVAIFFTFILLPPCWYFSIILSTALWGTWALCQSIMLMTGTNGNFMIVNIMRHIRVPATLSPPPPQNLTLPNKLESITPTFMIEGKYNNIMDVFIALRYY